VRLLAAVAVGLTLSPPVAQGDWLSLSGEPAGNDGHEWNGFKEFPGTIGDDLIFADLSDAPSYIPDSSDAGPEPSLLSDVAGGVAGDDVPMVIPIPWVPEPEPSFIDDHEWNGFKPPPGTFGDELSWDESLEDSLTGEFSIGGSESWGVDPQPGPYADGWVLGGGLFVAPQSAVPEPASVATLLLGAGLLFARRQRRQ
jgi:hypothetical protein